MPALRLLRLANPFVRAVLRSPAHRLLSGRLLLLGYRGRRSGRSYEIPLRYAETRDGQLVSVAVRPEQKDWWRSFLEPCPALVMLRGERLAVTGVVASDRERVNMLARYTNGRPRMERATQDAAVVVFTPTR